MFPKYKITINNLLFLSNNIECFNHFSFVDNYLSFFINNQWANQFLGFKQKFWFHMFSTNYFSLINVGFFEMFFANQPWIYYNHDLCISVKPKLWALSLELKAWCDFNPPTWMNMFIDEWFHMDECHFCMGEFHLWFWLNK